MDTDDITQHFGDVSTVTRVLKVTRAKFYSWRETGVPQRVQREVETLTAGALKRAPRPKTEA